MDLLLRTCSTDRMNIARIIARIFVVFGGLIWALMMFGTETIAQYADIRYTFGDIIAGGIAASIPLAATVIVFVTSLYYERVAALFLLALAAVTVVFGISAGWGPGLWGLVLVVIVAPIAIAALLFLVASRTQRVCELEGVPIDS